MAIRQRQIAETEELAPPMAAGSVPGHNNPPPDEAARDEFNTAIDAALRKRNLTRARFNELVAQAGRAEATDDETVGRCGELVKSLRAAIKLIDEIHEETKAPYLAAGREVDGLRNALKAPLDQAKKNVEALQGKYLRDQEALRLAAERKRRAEEAEARRAAEEKAREERPTGADQFLADAGVIEAPVAPPTPEPEIIRGDFGAAVSGQKVWVGEVRDYTVAFIAVADNEKVRDAIDKAIAGMVRAGSRQIEGVHIFQTLKASNR